MFTKTSLLKVFQVIWKRYGMESVKKTEIKNMKY
jgi:hypothetical protein